MSNPHLLPYLKMWLKRTLKVVYSYPSALVYFPDLESNSLYDCVILVINDEVYHHKPLHKVHVVVSSTILEIMFLALVALFCTFRVKAIDGP